MVEIALRSLHHFAVTALFYSGIINMQELIKPGHIRCQVVLSFLTFLHYKQINGIIFCRFGRHEFCGDLVANLSNVLSSAFGDPSVFAFIRSRLEWW